MITRIIDFPWLGFIDQLVDVYAVMIAMFLLVALFMRMLRGSN